MRRPPIAIILTASLVLAACGGGGSSGTTASSPSPTPAPTPSPAPAPTPSPAAAPALTLESYRNFKENGLTPQTLPSSTRGVGVVRAFGDFSGSGRLDLFSARLTYDVNTTTPANAPASVFAFWRLNADGSWTQDTTMLSSSAGCIHPRKAVVSDFNGDGRPDVFVACHGWDASPFPGERNKLVLSQPGGGYTVRDATADVGFHHAASTADLDGDGKADVVVVNNFDPASAFVLLGNGDGTFRREAAGRLPAGIGGKPYFTVELADVDADGKADLLLGGHEWEGATTRVYRNPGTGQFGSAAPTVLAAVANEGVVLDFALTGTGAARTVWVLRTSGGDGTFYQSRTVQKVRWSDGASTVPLSQRPAQWFQWLIPATVSGQAVMTTDDASFGVSLAQ